MDSLLKKHQESTLEENKKNAFKYSLYEINKIIGKTNDGDLTIIAGRASSGKTAFMCNELENLISNSDEENLVCNLEMSNEDVIERMIIKSSKRDIEYHTNTKFQSTEYKTTCKKMQTTIQKIHFYENLSNPKGIFVANKVRELLVKHPNIKNVFLDHMEELSFDTAIKREDIAIGQNYKLFKSIAKEFNVRMFLFTQLNRGLEDRKDKRPRKSDIKNTGVAEEITDKIILLYNKNMYKDKHVLKVEEEFIIDKNRKGATGTALCSYIKNINKYFISTF